MRDPGAGTCAGTCAADMLAQALPIPQDSDANGGPLVVEDEHHAVHGAVSHS